MQGKLKIQLFKEKILEEFKDNIACILLTGSYAREEVTQKSDIDIWLFFHALHFENLKTVGNIVKSLPKTPKLNAQCTTFLEAKSNYFIREYSPIQYNTDGIVLYGNLYMDYPKKEEFERQSKKLSVYVIMGIRHFIVTCEEDDVLIKKKIRKRILKPLMWAIRYKYAVILDKYIKNLDELYNVCNSKEREAICIYKVMLNGKEEQFKGNSMEILKLCNDICYDLMEEKFNF